MVSSSPKKYKLLVSLLFENEVVLKTSCTLHMYFRLIKILEFKTMTFCIFTFSYTNTENLIEEN